MNPKLLLAILLAEDDDDDTDSIFESSSSSEDEELLVAAALILERHNNNKRRNCKEAAMGKNKSKQTKNVLKVAGVKSTKLKSKAKPVNSQLKRINVHNKSKIMEMDKQLVELQDKVRQGPGTKESTNSTAAAKKTLHKPKTEKDYLNLQQKSQETLNDLNQMQL